MSGRRGVSRWVARALDRFAVIEEHRVGPTVDLAWPRIVTGFARTSQQTVDLAMVGIVLGPPALAGLAFAYAYWQIGNLLSVGLAGGTISLVSQNVGAERTDRADLVLKQSVWLGLAIALPLMGLYAGFTRELIELLGGNPAAVSYGAAYLQVLVPALCFEFLNKIASRTFAGVGDTLTPMVIRAGGAGANVVFNAVLIFGFGMGVVGAALGTLVATVLVTLVFAWGLLGRSYPGREPVPVLFRLRGPHWDTGIARQLVRVSTPLMFRSLAKSVVIFPLLAVASTFGSVPVAAFEIGRRVRGVINSLGWGFSIAASTLVGQHLGAGDEAEAEAYGRDIIRFSLVAYILLAVVVVAFAPRIARLFVDDPATVSLAATFIRIAAVSVVGLGIDGSATGVLRGAGDTRWPFYATLVGLYVFALPVAYVGVVTTVGIAALYAALLVETLVPAVLTFYRFRTNRWKSVSRAFQAAAGD